MQTKKKADFMSELIDIINNFSKARLLCIGDIMLDRYAYGRVSRTAPEGNAPVLLIDEEKLMLGGAGNVLSNLARLGAKTYTMGVIGDDATGSAIKHILQKQAIDIDGLIIDEARLSISKSRYVRRNTAEENEHIVRVDYEDTAPLSTEIETRFIHYIQSIITDLDGIVISDYRKGMITDKLAQEIIGIARENDIPVLIDSKIKDYTPYKGATLIKPNIAELEALLDRPIKDEDDIIATAQTLIKDYDLEALLVTRSEEGSSLITKQGNVSHNKNNVTKVIDVAGAGDSVIAATAIAFAAGADMETATYLGNIAGNYVVEHSGTTIISQNDLAQRVKSQQAA